MAANCRGICPRYRAPKRLKVGRYIDGQKRCNECDVFMRWDGFWCPCCGLRLRLTPRTGKYKEKFLESKAKTIDIETVEVNSNFQTLNQKIS